jgi:hypothetical protein
MAQDEREILALEEKAKNLGYEALEHSSMVGERELSDQFRWIASHLPSTINEKPTAERRRVRKEISKHTKELGDAVRAKHIQHNLPFRCIDDYDECVAKRKRQKQSPYLCSLVLFICLANSMTGLLAAIAAAAGAGGLLR